MYKERFLFNKIRDLFFASTDFVIGSCGAKVSFLNLYYIKYCLDVSVWQHK